ncbi:MAG: asparagine synthase-related protein [Acidobacteria bacterium]|nr:asparagine synthase-related protein [Acidobacteriota bacterium]MCI0721936.1 asparagine synthase-related protein [Acidobacteriota bacterium]
MSAQAGVWNFDGAPASREILANISQTISQYGPDGETTYVSGPIGMLYRPFHTTKESRLERQPHVSRCGSVITWDGRLDNRDELIAELRDGLNPKPTDLAVVIAAFESWGTDCFHKLVGDWALSIWDPVQRTLILARDYIGVRHVYYYPTHRRIIWCSYLAPLVLSGDRFTLNEQYIAGYLALYPESHLTPYGEIHAVAPGSFVKVREGRVTTHPYWAFHPEMKIRYNTDAEYEEHFRQVFRQAVRRRLRSDSPILAELSGGLDSSSIVCIADDILVKEGAETPRVDTLSFYDPREPDGDERPYFTKVEEKRGRKGYQYDAGTGGVLIPSRLAHFIGRPGDLGDTARKTEDFRRSLFEEHGYRVVLSGVGGDEFLGGVPNPGFQLADLIQQFRLIELGKQLIVWGLAKRKPWIQLLGQACAHLLPAWARANLTQDARIEPWIDKGFARRHRLSVRRLGPESKFGFRLRSGIAYARTIVLVSWQRAFAAERSGEGAEQRFAYLDQNLVEFLLAIPASQLLRAGERRSLMRRALRGLVPQEILDRKTKAVTVRKCLIAVQANWETLEGLFNPGVSSRLGFVSAAGFRKCLFRAKNGDAPQLVRMMKAIALELWLQDMVGRRLIHGPCEGTQVRVEPELVEMRTRA